MVYKSYAEYFAVTSLSSKQNMTTRLQGYAQLLNIKNF